MDEIQYSYISCDRESKLPLHDYLEVKHNRIYIYAPIFTYMEKGRRSAESAYRYNRRGKLNSQFIVTARMDFPM